MTSPQLLTAEEYSTLPEELGVRSELIEGVNVLSPMALYRHGEVIDTVQTLLQQQLPDMKVVRERGWKFRSPFGVDSVPGPDLMVVSPDEHRASMRAGRYFEGTPAFVIEVISPSDKRSRRMQKVGLYLEAGAGAVVEVVYATKTVLVHSFDAEIPQVVHDRIEWPFRAELAEIFEAF